MSKNSDIYRTAIGRRLVEVEENEEGEVTVVFGSSEDDESALGVQMTPLPAGRVAISAQ
jgi:hypothetical protein